MPQPPTATPGLLNGLRFIRESAAFVSSSGFALIEVQGRDAADYLHRRFSQNVKTMHVGRGAYALLLEGDGRLSLDLLIYRIAKGFLILVPELERERAADLIEKYVIMDDVTVVRAWNDFDVVSVAGPAAPDVVAAAGQDAVPDAGGEANVCTTPWKVVSPFQVGATAVHLMRDGRWMTPMYHVAIPRGEAAAQGTLRSACGTVGGGECDPEAAELHRLLEGIPLWGRELHAGLIPLEAGLTAGIDFNKGCFPGQEFLARIRNLGHPAHLLARLAIDEEHEIVPGAEIEIEGAISGHLTASATVAGYGKTAASGYVDWAARKADSCIIRGGGAGIAARIVSVVDRDTYDNNKKPTL